MSEVHSSAPVSEFDLEPTPPEVKRYQRLKLASGLASLAITLGLLIGAAFFLGTRLNDWLLTHGLENRWLRLVALAFVYAAAMELLTLPLDFYSGFVLEHRYQLSNQTLWRWVWKQVKAYLVAGPLALVLLLGFYTLVWFTGPLWWVWATIAWLAVTLVLGQLMPVLILPLFYKVTPLDQPDLLERLKRLAEGTGLKVEGIYRLVLSEETKKANAALAGLGRTRRVLLGDTLLNEFTPEEIEVVFAHEVGHHVHRHLLKLVVCSVFMSAAGFYLVNVILHAAAGNLGYPPFDADPASLPLVMLVLTVFGLLLGPTGNALSRFFERQCDRYALQRTKQPAAYRSVFVKLARLNKSDADPHPLVVWLFDDHPPIRQRLLMADAMNEE